MAEKQYTYTAKIKQPQMVVNVKLAPKGGELTEREYKSLKNDAYGASLLEKGLLIVEESGGTEPDANAEAGANAGQDEQNYGEAIPDFDSSNENSDISSKGYENGRDRPESHAGWKPE
jgi:hypothetical protein